MFSSLNFWLQLKFGCNSSEDHQFVRGIPIYAISQVLDKIISGSNGPPLLINGVKRPMPLLRILEVELYPTLLSKARSFGLSDNWVQVCFLLVFFFFQPFSSFHICNMCRVFSFIDLLKTWRIVSLGMRLKLDQGNDISLREKAITYNWREQLYSREWAKHKR